MSASTPEVVQISGSHGLGSGVVFDRRGDVVTIAHVVSRGGPFQVTRASGRAYRATVVATFAHDDIATPHAADASLPALVRRLPQASRRRHHAGHREPVRAARLRDQWHCERSGEPSASPPDRCSRTRSRPARRSIPGNSGGSHMVTSPARIGPSWESIWPAASSALRSWRRWCTTDPPRAPGSMPGTRSPRSTVKPSAPRAASRPYSPRFGRRGRGGQDRQARRSTRRRR
jgi:hypothetical protein